MKETWYKYGIITLLAVGFISYCNTFAVPFLYDDYFNILQNQAISNPTDIVSIFNCGFQETRPLCNLSLAFSYWVGSGSSSTFHILSVGLHLANALLLLALLSLLQARIKESHLISNNAVCLLIGAVFLLHPLQTESVAYINSRCGLFMAFFGFIGLISFVLFRLSENKKNRLLHFFVAIVAFMMSMFSKESGCVFPVLAALIDHWFLHEHRERKALLKDIGYVYAPLLASTLIVPLLFMAMKNMHQGVVGFDVIDKYDFWLTQPSVWLFFVGKFLLPISQNLYHDFPLADSVFDFAYWVGGIAILLLAVPAWRTRIRTPLFGFGMLWFAITLAPTNSIVPFKDFVSERHLYLPVIGLTMMLIGILQMFRNYANFGDKKFWTCAAVSWLLILSGLTIARNHTWRNEVRLWKDSSEKSPNRFRPVFNYGAALAVARDYEESKKQLTRALKMRPDDLGTIYNLGLVHRWQKDFIASNILLKQVLEMKPSHVEARIAMARNYVATRQYKNALDLLNLEIEKAHQLKLMIWRARIFLLAGQTANSEALLLQAAKIYDQQTSVQFELANFYVQTKQMDKAREAIFRAARMRKMDPTKTTEEVEALLQDMQKAPYLKFEQEPGQVMIR